MNNNSHFLLERFWSKVDVTYRERCWAWKGSLDDHGYGNFIINGKVIKAHRVAFFLRNGKWPKNLACHKCDNPPCCNPDHLFEGTYLDNARDMVSKRRQNKCFGEKHGKAILTDEKVRAIRSEYRAGGVSMTALGVKYGCSFSAARRVVKRVNWNHVT